MLPVNWLAYMSKRGGGQKEKKKKKKKKGAVAMPVRCRRRHRRLPSLLLECHVGPAAEVCSRHVLSCLFSLADVARRGSSNIHALIINSI